MGREGPRRTLKETLVPQDGAFPSAKDLVAFGKGFTVRSICAASRRYICLCRLSHERRVAALELCISRRLLTAYMDGVSTRIASSLFNINSLIYR